MTNSTRAGRKRRGARRSPLLPFAVVYVALLAGWNLLVAPRFPDNPRRTDLSGGTLVPSAPGTGPFYSSEDLAHARLVVVGDSRAHHGIVVEALDEADLGPTAVLWGSGAQLLELLPELRAFPARRVLVSLSPLSIYAERNPEFDEILARIKGMSTEKIDFLLDEWLDARRRAATCVVGTKTWGQSWFYEPNPARSNAVYVKRLREATRKQRSTATYELFEVMRGLVSDGWQLVCVRLPLSPQLLRIEEAAFPSSLFVQLCDKLGVPFLDYSLSDYATHDGTHLAAGDAARFSADLAAEIRDEVGW